MFEPETFDLTFARNALDHSYEPIRVIRNMIGLVKTGASSCAETRRRRWDTKGSIAGTSTTTMAT